MGFRRIGDGLAQLVTRWIDDPHLHEQVVLQAWERVCGPTLAAHARATALSDEVLYVVVDDRRWQAVILEMREPLLRRLRAEVGGEEVRELRLQFTGQAEGGTPPPSR